MNHLMPAYYFNAAVYDGCIFCLDCLPVSVDDAGVSPVFAGMEFESYPACDVCHRLIDYVTLIGGEWKCA